MLKYCRFLPLWVLKQPPGTSFSEIVCMRRTCASKAADTSATASKHLGLSSTSHSCETDNSDTGPIKFSTSKASPKVWTVENSFGSHYQRPWWKVLPVSLLGIGFLLWCVFREETEIDEKFDKTLFDHLPGLKPAVKDSELEVQQNKKT